MGIQEENFLFAGAARKLYPLENKCKQAEQRGGHLGIVRKSGKEKETFAGERK